MMGKRKKSNVAHLECDLVGKYKQRVSKEGKREFDMKEASVFPPEREIRSFQNIPLE